MTLFVAIPVEERFWEKVEPEPNAGCWLWMGSWNEKGYGHLWDGARVRPAHALAYEMLRGRPAVGLEPDHLCRTRSCVNPVRERYIILRRDQRG